MYASAEDAPMGETSAGRWSLVSDRLENGSYFRILTVVDQYTRECLAVKAGRSLWITAQSYSQKLDGWTVLKAKSF
jgi:hypothetical protein